MRYKLTPLLVVTLLILLNCVQLTYSHIRCSSRGSVLVYRRRYVRYCNYRYHGHINRVYYRGSRPRFYAGRPRCARRCYVKYTYINGRRVPVYIYTRRPVYGYRYVGRFTRRRRRVVYLKRPYYFVRRPWGRTYVVRGPLYGGYRHRKHVVLRRRRRYVRTIYIRSLRTHGNFRVNAKGCYYNGRFVRFGQVIHRSKCVKCRCLRVYNFAKLQCQTDGRCLQNSRRRGGGRSKKYGLEKNGCIFAGKLISFGSSSQVTPCKTCTCTGNYSSAYMKCHVDMACVRGGCNYRGKLLPHNQSIILGCKRCTCVRYRGRSLLYCKTDAACKKKAMKGVTDDVFIKKRKLHVKITHVHHHTKTIHKDGKDDKKKDTPFEKEKKSTKDTKIKDDKKDTKIKDDKSKKDDKKKKKHKKPKEKDKKKPPAKDKTPPKSKKAKKPHPKKDNDKKEKPPRKKKESDTTVVTKPKERTRYCRYKGKKFTNKGTFILKKCIKCTCIATKERTIIHCSKDKACSDKTVVVFDSIVERGAVMCYHKNKRYTKGQTLTIFKRFCRCEQLNGEAVIRCYKTKPGSKRTERKDTSKEDKKKAEEARKKAEIKKIEQEARKEAEKKKAEDKKRTEDKKKAEEAEKKKSPTKDKKNVEVEATTKKKIVKTSQRNTKISYSIRRNSRGCFFDGTHVPFNGRIERKCLVCICLQHTRQVFYCRKKLACIRGKSVATCYYDKNSYIIGEPFRRNCKHCFCGTDVAKKPIIRCYKDPSCYSGTTTFCQYGRRKYAMGVVFNIRKCVRCACLLMNGRAKVRCTVDKNCMGERTNKDDTTVKVMSSSSAVRREEEMRRGWRRRRNGPRVNVYSRISQNKAYQRQLAREFHNSQFPRSINIYVNRPPPAGGASKWRRAGGRWEGGRGGGGVGGKQGGHRRWGHCILDRKPVAFNQRVRLSKCRTCVCLEMPQPAFYCKHDPSCAETKKKTQRRTEQMEKRHKKIRCRIGSIRMSVGQVIHLKHCTFCRCIKDASNKALLSCGFVKKCKKKSKDTPLVGLNSKQIKRSEFDGCRRKGKLYSFGSGFMLNECKECRCARVPAGKVFICKRSRNCDSKLVHKRKRKTSRIDYGKGPKGTKRRRSKGESGGRRSKKTLIMISPEKLKPRKKKKKIPTIFCIYQGTKTGLGNSVKISKCLVCICKRQKYNPVFDCKKTRYCIRKALEKQSRREEEEREARRARRRVERERSRRRRSRELMRERIRDMQRRARRRIRERSRRRVAENWSVDIQVGSSSTPVYGVADQVIFHHPHSYRHRRPVHYVNFRHHRDHRRPIRYRDNINYRMHKMYRSRNVLFAQDQENSGCSYAGITMPRGQSVMLNACVSCQCTGYHGDKLMCHRHKNCNPRIHAPGCHYGGVTIPRNGLILRGRCRYCRCEFGENGFGMVCRRQKHCDVSNRPPQSLPRHTYPNGNVRGGCRLAYGVIINNGSKVFDKSSCTTCLCLRGQFHCNKLSSCDGQHSGCFVDGRYAAPESHSVRGCRNCVCQREGHFNCQLDAGCLQRNV